MQKPTSNVAAPSDLVWIKGQRTMSERSQSSNSFLSSAPTQSQILQSSISSRVSQTFIHLFRSSLRSRNTSDYCRRVKPKLGHKNREYILNSTHVYSALSSRWSVLLSTRVVNIPLLSHKMRNVNWPNKIQLTNCAVSDAEEKNLK